MRHQFDYILWLTYNVVICSYDFSILHKNLVQVFLKIYTDFFLASVHGISRLAHVPLERDGTSVLFQRRRAEVAQTTLETQMLTSRTYLVHRL